MDIANQVLKTRNYSIFKFMDDNRTINVANLTRIMESMSKEQLIIPIIVNEDYEIIDGQHRFKACEKLDLPVYFIMVEGYDSNQMILANAGGGRKWFAKDYLEHYCVKGNNDYLKIQEIISEYNINVYDFLKILSFVRGQKNTLVKKEFIDGVISLDGADLVVSFLLGLQDFKQYSFYNNGHFVSAFMKLYFHEDYEHDYMVRKLATYGHNLKPAYSSEEYLSLLCNKIYSFAGAKRPIYYSRDNRKFHQ